MKRTISNSIRGSLLIPLALTCFGLSPKVRACSQGDLGNAITAEAARSLTTSTTGTNNTALGARALNKTTTTSWNSSIDAQALCHNIGRNNSADRFQAPLNYS